jgi:hypothetical protein
MPGRFEYEATMRRQGTERFRPDDREQFFARARITEGRAKLVKSVKNFFGKNFAQPGASTINILYQINYAY